MHITANLRQAAAAAYGVYVWLALAAAVVPVLAGLVVVPGVHRRRRLARGGARAFFRLAGIPLDAVGPSVPVGDTIVVANHASYLDGIVLTAVLPARYTFLIKHEMARVPIAGFVLRRLGSEFVNRTNHGHRHRTARRLVNAARSGQSLAFFPEGTFDAAPGLKAFQLGAFSAACRAGLAVVPAVIAGTRAALPAGCWLPRRAPIHVRFLPPLTAADSPRALLQAARDAILDHLDEPDLAPPATVAAQRPESAPATTASKSIESRSMHDC